jgi:hypothetical protein
MRHEGLVTSLSWIPSEAVAGGTRLAFDAGFTHYDEPPPGAAFQKTNLNQKVFYHRVGTPQSGGLGNVVAGALEQSNVAIAQEFIDLISTQRSFQANARVITSSDALLNDLINIVR